VTYEIRVLTPTLVSDGDRLSPIDYMVWKDQVNVLDQNRIFRLLSKGPRLEGYLTQLRRADKLDFASWGGFAQNYAERRIPFEHATMTPVWNEARPESLFIPTFCSGPSGPYLPATAIKGALRTAVAFTRWNPSVVREVASRFEGDRPPRRPGEAAEAMTMGSSANDPMRAFAPADSAQVPPASFRVYLLRVAALEQRGNNLELGWKQAARGYAPAGRPELAVPTFAEMAVPGTAFRGDFQIHARGGKREHAPVSRLLEAANQHASALLQAHRQYAERARLQRVQSSLERLESELADLKDRRNACLLNVGWAGGYLSKAAFLDTENEDLRKILRRFSYYERAIRTGLPFPKTRRIVFEQGQPSTLPGWVLLQLPDLGRE
jgi:CRISPR-associated protein Csm5